MTFKKIFIPLKKMADLSFLSIYFLISLKLSIVMFLISVVLTSGNILYQCFLFLIVY